MPGNSFDRLLTVKNIPNMKGIYSEMQAISHNYHLPEIDPFSALDQLSDLQTAAMEGNIIAIIKYIKHIIKI